MDDYHGRVYQIINECRTRPCVFVRALGTADVTGGFRRKDLDSRLDAKREMPVVSDILPAQEWW